MEGNLKHNTGYCVICEKEAIFIEHNDWLRDHYLCSTCHSIPRQRAFNPCFKYIFPKMGFLSYPRILSWRDYDSATNKNCKNYTYSQYFKNYPLGQYFQGIRCENLEDMNFQNESFDLFITQDVFEHVMEPKSL